MTSIRFVSDAKECERLWNRLVPRETIWDLWEVRRCFDRHFSVPPLSIVAEERGRPTGLLPLSWIEESSCYGCFPGETWEGKTWIEQNRIIANNEETRQKLLEAVPAAYQLRYLREMDSLGADGNTVDEVGYLFEPSKYGFSMENYFGEFSHKSLKRLRRSLEGWESLDIRYKYNCLDDFEILVTQNLGKYEERSYFHDIRFRESIRSLMHFLDENGWLRITTVLVNGEPAAVDLGSVYRSVYTLIAGGTSPEFLGIAKLINIHHMAWACEQKLREVDFLCGEFSWKPMFHLTPRPLFCVSRSASLHQIQAVRVKEAGNVR
jgi:hypothetical protein